MLKDVEQMKADFLAWAAKRPPKVRAVAEQYPMWNCYRSTKNRGHYQIGAYMEPRNPHDPVTVTLVHGTDSFLPGVAVYGQPPDELEPCGCGEWLPPTKEQIAETRAEIEADKASGRYGKCGDPACEFNHED